MSNTTFTEKKSIFEAGLEEGISVKGFNRQGEPCIWFLRAIGSKVDYTDYTNAANPVSFICSEITAESLERDPHLVITCTAARISDGEAKDVPNPEHVSFSTNVILIIDYKQSIYFSIARLAIIVCPAPILHGLECAQLRA